MNSTQLLITYGTAGSGGDAYTLAASVATPSGGTLTGGGSGTSPTGTLDVGPETGTYPGVVAYFQQRRVYAATNNAPDTYFMSQPGAYLNFDSSIPTISSDAITGTPWSQQVNGIQWLIQIPAGLVALTGLGTWVVNGEGGSNINPQPVTPSSDQALQQGFNGANNICQPFVQNYDIIFVQAMGSVVRDVFTGSYFNIFVGNDLTILSGQLFTGYALSQVAWTEEPFKVAWYVRNDGALLSLTYLKEQEVYGWARHDTYGQFVSVCSVIELPVNALYTVVQRNAAQDNNLPFYYIERMNNRIWNQIEHAWCVDCAFQYPQPAPNASISTTTLTGSATFTASASVFSSGDVGSVLRVGGGIATITGYTNGTTVTATWNLPPAQDLHRHSQFVPDATVRFLDDDAADNHGWWPDCADRTDSDRIGRRCRHPASDCICRRDDHTLFCGILDRRWPRFPGAGAERLSQYPGPADGAGTAQNDYRSHDQGCQFPRFPDRNQRGRRLDRQPANPGARVDEPATGEYPFTADLYIAWGSHGDETIYRRYQRPAGCKLDETRPSGD